MVRLILELTLVSIEYGKTKEYNLTVLKVQYYFIYGMEIFLKTIIIIVYI